MFRIAHPTLNWCERNSVEDARAARFERESRSADLARVRLALVAQSARRTRVRRILSNLF